MSTPSAMTPRIRTPNHRGLGLRFFCGGGMYRLRLDFDFGMEPDFTAVYLRGSAGASWSVARAARSTAARVNGIGWWRPLVQSSVWSFQCGDSGSPDCPVGSTPRAASGSERSTIWRHDGT